MRNRRSNIVHTIAGIMLSLGLAFGSLTMPGIIAAEQDIVDEQNTMAEGIDEEQCTEIMPEYALSGTAKDSAETETEDVKVTVPAEESTETTVPAEDTENAEMESGEMFAGTDGEEMISEAEIPDMETADGFLDDSGLIEEIEVIVSGSLEASDDVTASDGFSGLDGGDCGLTPGSVTWTLDEEGTIEVAGTGEMISWESPEQVPWNARRDEIRRIEIAEGVTSVGAYAFCGCDAAESVSLAESVCVIGEEAFSQCSGFTTVSIG